MSELEINDAVEPTGAATTTAQTVATEPEIKVTDDGNQVIRGDVKYIREEALRAEREQNKQLKAQLDQIAPFIPEFTEFLNNKRSGRTAAVETATQGGDADGYTEDELRGVAQLRGYYTEDGQSLDLNRAKQDLKLMDRLAERRARSIVEPVVQTTARDRAARNYQAAISRQYTDGKPIADAKFIEQAFNALPADLAADEGVGNLVQVLAAGLEYLDIRQSGRPVGTRREPGFTEGGTGRLDGYGGRGNMTPFAARAAQARGYTAEQWAKLQEKPTPEARPDRDGGFILETGL